MYFYLRPKVGEATDTSADNGLYVISDTFSSPPSPTTYTTDFHKIYLLYQAPLIPKRFLNLSSYFLSLKN